MDETKQKCGKQTSKNQQSYTDKNELANKSNEDIDKTE